MQSMWCACACSNRSVVPSEANPAYTRRIISSIMSIPDLIGCSGLVLFLLVCNDIISLGCLIDLQSVDICQHVWKTHGKPMQNPPFTDDFPERAPMDFQIYVRLQVGPWDPGSPNSIMGI